MESSHTVVLNTTGAAKQTGTSISTIAEPKSKIFGEKEAGIEEYLSPDNIAIQCTIKHRFSDFIVNEIDENGKAVWFEAEKDF